MRSVKIFCKKLQMLLLMPFKSHVDKKLLQNVAFYSIKIFHSYLHRNVLYVLHSQGKLIQMFIEIYDHTEISKQILLLDMGQLSQEKFIEKVEKIHTTM